MKSKIKALASKISAKNSLKQRGVKSTKGAGLAHGEKTIKGMKEKDKGIG